MKLLKQLIKYIPLLIELRLTELNYNLYIYFNRWGDVMEIIKLRQKIEEIRDKIKEI